MTEKKIGTCIKALINVGNYQNIEVAKYAETTISYESEEERIEKEDKQTKELLDSLKRDLQKTPEELNAYEDKVEAFKESVSKEMPKWLGEGVVPNIANSAKAVKEKSDAKKVDEVVSKSKIAEEFEKSLSDTEEEKVVQEAVVSTVGDTSDDLFPTDDDDLFID